MKENISEKERFFSKVSHDLRGSFTSILGFSDILSDPTEKLTNEEIFDFTTRIGKQSHDTFELLVNFVNWLKVENYDYGLSPEKNELFELLLDVKNQCQKSLTEKNILINSNIATTETVFLDYEIAQSILNNTFSFLIKTSSNNSQINVESVSCTGKYSCIEIKALCNNEKLSFLQNIDLKDLNNEISFPIIFAIKFTEQSGGEFKLSIDQENNIVINLKLPSE